MHEHTPILLVLLLVLKHHKISSSGFNITHLEGCMWFWKQQHSVPDVMASSLFMLHAEKNHMKKKEVWQFYFSVLCFPTGTWFLKTTSFSMVSRSYYFISLFLLCFCRLENTIFKLFADTIFCHADRREEQPWVQLQQQGLNLYLYCFSLHRVLNN